MSLGDMLRAQRDAEDAARYRWLKSQFRLEVDRRDFDELVEEDGNRRTYEKRVTYSAFFNLVEDWRFGGTELSSPRLDFDAVIDKLMGESAPPPEAQEKP